MSAEQTLNSKITNAVASAVNSPVTAAQPEDVKPISASVIAAVVPAILSATNNEPWYQSRVTIGAIVSIAIPILGLIGIKSDVIDANQLTALLVAAGSVVGGIITIYGRWKAKTPIGN